MTNITDLSSGSVFVKSVERDAVKISACLITKNEASNLVRCIDSFKHSVDEIIIVDTGSTDDTVKIARKLGAKVYYFKWNNDFSSARNYALQQAKGNWIIFPDADEYFYGETGRNIRPLLTSVNSDKSVDGLICKMLDLSENGQIRSTSYSLRIFKNSRKIRYKGQIHEQVCKDGQQLNLISVEDSKLLLCHTGYNSEALLQIKQKRNLELLLKDLDENPSNSAVHAYLSFCYSCFADHENVIKHARMFLDSNCKGFDQTAKVYYAMITSMMKAGYNPDTILPVIETAINEFPEHPDLLWVKGRLLFDTKKYSDALDAFNKAVEFGMRYNDSQYTLWPSYLSHIYSTMGLIHELKNEHSEAEFYYTKALLQNKRDSPIMVRLLKLMGNQRQEEIRFLLEKIYNSSVVEDVKFVTSILAQLKYKDVLNYYYDIWQRRFGQANIAEPFVLLANAHYEKAFKFFSIHAVGRNDGPAILALVSALLSNNTNLIEKFKPTVSSTLQRLIDCFLGKIDGICLTDKDFDTYIRILAEVLRLENGTHVSSWLKLKENFDYNISFKLGNFLFSEYEFNAAFSQFTAALNSDCCDKKILLFKLGFCSYKTLNYHESVNYLEQAFNEGYREYDLFEILNWVYEKTDDNILREKIEALTLSAKTG